MELTPAQRLAVDSNKKEILVSASAGGGKTHVMTERVIRLVLDGVPIESMIICTFTKAAAAEIRARLLNKLQSAAVKNDIAAAALISLPLCEISTIDSFCLRLVKNYFYYADIDPNIESADETVGSALLTAAAYEAIEEAFLNPTPEFLELIEILSPRKNEGVLGGVIERLYRFAAIMPEPLEWFKSVRENAVADIGKITADEPLAETVKTKPHTDTLIDLAVKTAEIYEKKKRKKLCADFNDIERAAYKILCNPEAIAAVNEKYRYLFVDEFQDINPLQDKIFEKLDCNKFFVGDIKQSIFGFRLTDPSIFLNKLNGKESKGRTVVNLNLNYRGDSRILGFCDRVFNNLMTEEFGGSEYAAFGTGGKGHLKGERLPPPVICNAVTVPKAEKRETAKRGIYSVLEHSEPLPPPDAKTAEINLIINHILRLKNSAINKDGVSRDTEFNDITILLRSISGYAESLCDALRAAGIPYSVQKRDGESPLIIRRLIGFLKLLDNRRDDAALLTVLKSSIGGSFTDRELAVIRQRGGGGDLFDAVLGYIDGKAAKNDGIRERLVAFIETLNRFTELKFALPIAELAGKACVRFGLFMRAVKGGAGDELSAFLDGLLNYDGLSFSEALNAAHTAKKSESPLKYGGGVRIMTVHASKGLEFPFVILPQLQKKFNSSDIRQDCILDGEYGVAVKYWDAANKKAYKTPLYLAAVKKAKKKLIEEEMRLLYVAMTRAEYGLYLSAAVSETRKDREIYDADSFLDFIYPEFNKIAAVYDVGECKLCEPLKPKKIKFPVSAELKQKIEDGDLRFKENAAKMPDAPYKVTVTSIARNVDDTPDGFIPQFVKTEKAGMRIGTAYHKLFETADYTLPLSEILDRFKDAYNEEAKLISAASALAALAKLKDKINGRENYRESGFVYTDGGGTLVQGVIDLLIDDNGGGFELVDYKTGVITADRLISYKKQVDAYSDACAAILKKQVTKKWIFSINSLEFIEI